MEEKNLQTGAIFALENLLERLQDEKKENLAEILDKNVKNLETRLEEEWREISNKDKNFYKKMISSANVNIDIFTSEDVLFFNAFVWRKHLYLPTKYQNSLYKGRKMNEVGRHGFLTMFNATFVGFSHF